MFSSIYLRIDHDLWPGVVQIPEFEEPRVLDAAEEFDEEDDEEWLFEPPPPEVRSRDHIGQILGLKVLS